MKYAKIHLDVEVSHIDAAVISQAPADTRLGEVHRAMDRAMKETLECIGKQLVRAMYEYELRKALAEEREARIASEEKA